MKPPKRLSAHAGGLVATIQHVARVPHDTERAHAFDSGWLTGLCMALTVSEGVPRRMSRREVLYVCDLVTQARTAMLGGK